MSIISVVIILVVIGVCLYLIETYVPMPPPIKLIIRVIVILLLVVWLLQIFGITGPSVRLR